MVSYYKHLTLGERNTIEEFLNKNKSARSIAFSLDRTVTTITNEVKRNRLITRGKYKSMPAKNKLDNYSIDKICPKLQKWPYVCNGCTKRYYGCSRIIKTEYTAPEANGISTATLKNTRKGININRYAFEEIIHTIKQDLKRGLSPYQISVIHDEFPVSQSTIYRWVSKGYGEMCALDLRRKVKYKPRNKNKIVQTTHGKERSYSAFCELSQDIRDSACEMDTVIGFKNNKKCILTLYLRSCKLQIAVLLKEKTVAEVNFALDALEEYCQPKLFNQLFGTILTDNGTEFSDFNKLEQSSFGDNKRTRIYYCDIRASNQKGSCEKNHVEIRKIIPKRQGIDFDKLDIFDMCYINSQVNSQPRKSLFGYSPIEIFKKLFGESGCKFLNLLGIVEIPKESLNLTYEGLIKNKKLWQ